MPKTHFLCLLGVHDRCEVVSEIRVGQMLETLLYCPRCELTHSECRILNDGEAKAGWEQL